MMTAVRTNVKSSHQCLSSQRSQVGFNIAIQGGSVVGLSLISLGVLALFELFKLMLTPENCDDDLGYFAKKYQLPFENTDGR